MDPSGFGQALPASEAPVMERALFLQRTYSWLLGGIVLFAATLWASINVEGVREVMMALRVNIFLAFAIIIGISFAMRAVATKYPINALVYALTTVVYGLLIGPLVYMATQTPGLEGTVEAASMMTALVFLGLTLYVFMSGKDFSFLGGALTIAVVALIAVGLAGWLLDGFHFGIYYSAAAVIVFAGFILYDTSNILRHYPTNMHIAAAATLFIDVVIMFKHILFLLISSRD